jgi:hypothetical protein
MPKSSLLEDHVEDEGLLRHLTIETIQELLQRHLEFLVAPVFAQQGSESADFGDEIEGQPAVSLGNVGASLVDRLLGGSGLRTADDGLQEQLAEKEAAERPIGVDGLRVGEAVPGQRGEERVHDLDAA